MVVSEFFDEQEVISQLRMFVDLNEEDIQSCLSQIVEKDENTYELTVNNRVFQFDKILCDVEEVE